MARKLLTVGNRTRTQVFGTGQLDDATLESSVILAPKNDAVAAINQHVRNLLPGPAVTFVGSSHLVPYEEGPPQPGRGAPAVNSDFAGLGALQEEVQGLNRGKMPPHRLVVKVGSVVMLLKNFSKSQGLCNGTRMRVIAMGKNAMCLRRITPFAGRRDCVWFPKMWMRCDDFKLGGSVQRYQFPVSPAFAMSINKGQGQTFQRVGVFLLRPCFSHGQFYVAVSRVTSGDGLKVLVVRGADQGILNQPRGGRGGLTYTKNLVMRRLLH